MNTVDLADINGTYECFDRNTWKSLAMQMELPLTDADVRKLASLGDPIDIAEADAVYRPLSAFLQLQLQNYWERGRRQKAFFQAREEPYLPFIIGIGGSVAVGKSTTARLLQHLLSRWPDTPKVELITTDGFLLPNEELARRGLMARKGFPESYDRKALLGFLQSVKSGQDVVRAPVYSHITYNVLPDEYVEICRPDILIVEGINVLQPAWKDSRNYVRASNGEYISNSLAVSDFFDFSIYVDAATEDIQEWYVERFLKLKETAFTNPSSYFKIYADVAEDVAREIALGVWQSVNLPNLENEILPTRERADLIIRKGSGHVVERVFLRRI